MLRNLTRLHFTAGLSAISLLLLYLLSNNPLLLTHLNQVSLGVEQRIQWWDWKDTPEERYCRSAHHGLRAPQGPIPNVIHFISLSDHGADVDLDYATFLALKAAVLRSNATQVKLHTTGLNTRNRWWKEIERHVTLVMIDRSELHAPNGVHFNDLLLAHQADILRLSILLREGGIYLDTDVYALKSFEDLLGSPRDVLMGHEGGNRYGLCNAVIFARAGSDFLSIWQQSYNTFNPHVWNEHSVRKPKQLQIQHPHLICPLSPTVFFWPTWAKTHVHYMHRELLSPEKLALLQADLQSFRGAMYENQLAFHSTGAHEYLRPLTPETVGSRDTRFNVLVREIANAPL